MGDVLVSERIILHLINDSGILAIRAARHLLEQPEKDDALLEYGDSNDPPTFYAKRNKHSVTVWEQPRRTTTSV